MSHKRPHEEYHDPDYPSGAVPPHQQPHDGSAVKRAKTSADNNNTDSGNNSSSSREASTSCAVVRTPAETTELVRRIVQREFAVELGEREQELRCIEQRLLAAKRLLQRVRYAVVYSFYTNKRLVYTDSELRNELTVVSMATEETVVSSSSAPPSVAQPQAPPPPLPLPSNVGASTSHGWPPHPADAIAASQPPATPLPQQAAVHPSLKKLLGTTVIDYNEILKVRPARQAAKDAKTSIAEKLRTKKDERRLRMAAMPAVPLLPADTNTTTAATEQPAGALKVPRYVSPIKSSAAVQSIKQINTARGAMRHATRHLVAVGNTSMYIGDTGDTAGTPSTGSAAAAAGGVTHKWLVYVQSKTARSVEDMVHKVRFFLHPSYKPNDVVDVSSAPFQIARRGWGEFPVRVQLFFHPHVQQKPLQIFHQLVLDKKRTGLQTMGAETVVEMWLNLAAVREEPTPAVAPAVVPAPIPAPIVKTPSTQKKITTERLPRVVIQQPPSNQALEQHIAVPDDIQLEETVMSSEPCWDPDGLIKSVQISEAEQSSLMAMAEESKRFGPHLLASPPHRNNGSTAAAVPNGQSTANGVAWPSPPAAAAKPASAPVTISFAPVPIARNAPNTTKPNPVDGVPIPIPTTSTPLAVPAQPVVLKSQPPNSVAVSLGPNAAPTQSDAPKAVTAPLRKFVKCLNTSGKVIMVEVETDPNNPKSLRIVPKSSNSSATTRTGIAGPSALPSVSPSHVMPSTIPNVVVPKTIITPPFNNSATKPIAVGPPVASQRIVVMPKNHTSQSTQSTSSSSPLVRPAAAATPAAAAPVPASTGLKALPNTKKVIMRNGKMFIIDTSQFVSRPIPQIATTSSAAAMSSSNTVVPATVGQSKPASVKITPASATNPVAHTSAAKPKQQSLLKPQISLLKSKLPKPPPPNAAAPSSRPAPPALQPPRAQLPLRPTAHPAATPTVVPLKFAMKLPINATTATTSISAGPRTYTMPMPLIRRGLIRPPSATATATPVLLPTFQARAGSQPQRIRIANIALRPAVMPPTHQHLHHHRRPITTMVLPPEKSLFSSAMAAQAVRPRIDYRHDLQQRFLGRCVVLRTQRAAVEWLLRHVPQVHRLAGANADYAQAFPFVADRPQTFEAYVWPKQRSVEWLRAKFVGRLLAKWSAKRADGGGGGGGSWTTKEIVLFARRFGYSLPIRPANSDYTQTTPTATTTTTSTSDANPSGTAVSSSTVALSTLIKLEIKRGERTHDEPTFTVNASVQQWLDAWHARRNRRRRQPAVILLDEDVIDVTGDAADESAAKGGGAGNGALAVRKAGRVMVNGVLRRRPKGLYPLPAALRTEAGWVSDVCNQVQVKLQPEEIVDGELGQ